MDINKLQTFLKIAKYGSFRSASEKLFLSPRAVSKQMDQIENELGVKLFDRHKNNTNLTRMGKEFIVTARDIVNSYTDAYNRIQIESASDLHKIIIGFSSQNQATIIQKNFEDFLVINPDTQLEIREESGETLVNMVKARQLHIAVTPAYKKSKEYGPDIGAKKIISGEMVVGVSRLNPLSKQDEIDLNLLQQYRVLYYNNSESKYLQNVFHSKFGGIFPKSQIQRVSSTEQRDMLIALNQGIGFFPKPVEAAESLLNPMIKFMKISNNFDAYYASMLLYNKQEDNTFVRKFVTNFN